MIGFCVCCCNMFGNWFLLNVAVKPWVLDINLHAEFSMLYCNRRPERPDNAVVGGNGVFCCPNLLCTFPRYWSPVRHLMLHIFVIRYLKNANLRPDGTLYTLWWLHIYVSTTRQSRSAVVMSNAYSNLQSNSPGTVRVLRDAILAGLFDEDAARSTTFFNNKYLNSCSLF
jgi:hypothetical protein